MIKKLVSKVVLLSCISGILSLDASQSSYALTEKTGTTIIISSRKRKSSLEKINTILFNEIGIEHITEEKNIPTSELSFVTHLGMIGQHSAFIDAQLEGLWVKYSLAKNELLFSKKQLDIAFDHYKKGAIQTYNDFLKIKNNELPRDRQSSTRNLTVRELRQTVNRLNNDGIALIKQFENLRNDIQKYTNITGFGLLLFCCFVNGVIMQYMLMS